MARQPISMRHVKEILRLKLQNELSVREIARSCGIPASTVGDYIQRAEAAGLSWPLPEGISDSELMERLSPPAEGPEAGIKPLPNWPQIREELGRKSVTLRLLWQEYRNVHPTGYGYSRFCELYERWADTLDPVLRQTHEPGRKLFVDWAGQTTPIYHPDGTITQASLFVAVLGFSNRIFAEAFPDQQLDSWISAHIHVFEFLNGVTAAVVLDYVSGHIIGIMFPAGLCARLEGSPCKSATKQIQTSHNLYRDLSHFRSSASSLQMDFLRDSFEEAEAGGWHASRAASFIRRLISA
jgi:hypothetical protein